MGSALLTVLSEGADQRPSPAFSPDTGSGGYGGYLPPYRRNYAPGL